MKFEQEVVLEAHRIIDEFSMILKKLFLHTTCENTGADSQQRMGEGVQPDIKGSVGEDSQQGTRE